MKHGFTVEYMERLLREGPPVSPCGFLNIIIECAKAWLPFIVAQLPQLSTRKQRSRQPQNIYIGTVVPKVDEEQAHLLFLCKHPSPLPYVLFLLHNFVHPGHNELLLRLGDQKKNK